MRYRWFVLPAAGIAAVLLGVLLFGNLNDNLVYYLTPSEALARRADFPDGQRLRLGGLVEPGSVRRVAGGVGFTLTDGRRSVPVAHQGAPSQLF
jgi:cytochrome c-type biogenesis protein CcmE